MTIRGWRTRWAAQDPAGHVCAACGHREGLLYQGQQYVTGAGWHDLPEVLLCEVCRETRLDSQRAEQDSGEPYSRRPDPPHNRWRFWQGW